MSLRALIVERLHQMQDNSDNFKHYKYDNIRSMVNTEWIKLQDAELLDLFECVTQKYYMSI